MKMPTPLLGAPPDPTPSVPGTSLLSAKPALATKQPRPLYRSWWFWTIAGGLFAGTVALTYAVTRPAPTPYFGTLGNVAFP